MADDSLTISFDLTREDCLRYLEEHLAHSILWRLHRRVLWKTFLRHAGIASGLTAAAAGLALASVYGPLNASEPLLVASFFPALGWWVWAATLWPGRVQRAHLARLDDALREGSPHLGDHVVRVSPRGVEVRKRAITAHFGWPAIVLTTESSVGLAFQHIESSGFIVPRRAFATSRDYQSFVDLARSLHAASGFDPAGRISDYLQYNHTRCPKCRIDLHGCKHRSCPGCRRELNFEALPEAMRHIPQAARRPADTPAPPLASASGR